MRHAFAFVPSVSRYAPFLLKKARRKPSSSLRSTSRYPRCEDKVRFSVMATFAWRRTSGGAARTLALGEPQWIPTIPAQTHAEAPLPPSQILLATASCSALLARYAAGPVPPYATHVLGMIW